MEPEPSQSALQTLKHNGRSFYFASFFLGKETTTRAARLYHFCRVVDDLVDEQKSPSDQVNLHRMEGDIKRGVSSDPVVSDFLDLCETCNITWEAALYLIAGVRSDITDVRLKTQDDLIQYCYRVAGTVGLMMCPILKARGDQADYHAIDLGIAMQLTNIARDVLEDAHNDRRYLPASKLGNLSPPDIIAGRGGDKDKVKRATADILTLAESYYKSGEDGLLYLPPRHHLAILVAARIYRHIGVQLKNSGYDIWAGRQIVSWHKKCLLALAAVFHFAYSRSIRRKPREHNASLHLNIQGFPGADAPHTRTSFVRDKAVGSF